MTFNVSPVNTPNIPSERSVTRQPGAPSAPGPEKRRKIEHQDAVDGDQLWQIISHPVFYTATNEGSDTFSRMVQDAIYKAAFTKDLQNPKDVNRGTQKDIDARLWLKKLLSVIPKNHHKAINALDENGSPPINYAVSAGKDSLRRLLVKHGANWSSPEEIRRAQARLYQETSESFSPASVVAIRHALSVPGVDMNRRYQQTDDRNPLIEAFFNNRLDHAEILLNQRHVDINRATPLEKQTALHLASLHSDAEGVKMLLAKPGIKLNPEDVDGETPLLYAASQPPIEQNRKIVELLLAQPGVDGNHPNKDGETALMKASEAQNLETCLALLAQPGINVNHPNEDGKTALTLAAASGADSNLDSMPIIESLLAMPGIQMNQFDEDGNTPLIAAARMNFLAGVKSLLSHPELDLNWGRQGRKALDWALGMQSLVHVARTPQERQNNQEIINLLREKLKKRKKR